MKTDSADIDLYDLHGRGMGPARSLTANVLKHLAGIILRGDRKPGDMLGTESSMTEELQVSRTVLREAIKVLSGKGLVESRQGAGTRVLPQERWNLLDRDVLGWMIAEKPAETFMWDLHELRAGIEPAAAALAAKRATDADMATLAEACDDMAASGRDVEAFATADLKFHLTVLYASHNDFYRALATGVRTALIVYLRMTGEDAAAFDQGRPLHLAVLQAIRAGQAAQAAAAMEDLLDGSLEVIGRLNKNQRGKNQRQKRG